MHTARMQPPRRRRHRARRVHARDVWRRAVTVEIDKRRRASLPAEGVYAPVQSLVVTCEVLLARTRRNELERRGEDTGTRTQAAPLLVRLTQDRSVELDRGSRVRALPRGHHARQEFRECCACCGAR